MSSIRSQLIAAMSVLLLFVIVQGLVTHYYVQGSMQLTTSAIDHDFSASNELARIAVEAQAIRRYEKEFIIYLTDSDRMAKYRKEWGVAFGRIDQAVSGIVQNKSGTWTSAEREEAQRWQEAIAAYGDGFNALVAEAEIGRLRDTRKANEQIGPAKDKFRVLIDGVAKMSAEKYSAAQTAARKVEANFSAMNNILGAIALAGVLLASILTVSIPIAISRPIQSLAISAQRMGTGDLSQPIQANGPVEFKELAETLERMRVSQRILIDRMKTKTG